VPPANDNFADAKVITSLSFSKTVDASGATTESGEPQSCNSSNNTIWYSFTPSQAMWVRVDMWGGPSETNLAVYRAYGPGIGDLSYVGCNSWSPSVEFQAEAGATYYFQAGTVSWYSPGTLQINVNQLPSPENDNFASAQMIGSLPSARARISPMRPRSRTSPSRPVPIPGRSTGRSGMPTALIQTAH